MVDRKLTRLSILILSEDSASDGYKTIVAIVKKMLKLIMPDIQTQLIAFDPNNDRAARGVFANRWKSKEKRDHQILVDLRRSIANKLLEGDDNLPSFVLFHFDGDKKWSDRLESENAIEFMRFLNCHIRPAVLFGLRKTNREGELEVRMKRLIPLAPYYSIEAWLYQNTAVARRICNENGCKQHFEQFGEWEKDRGQLDEVVKPKSRDFCCLGSQNNRKLAEENFPAEAALDAGKSFLDAVWSLTENTTFTDALELTKLQESGNKDEWLPL